MRICGDVFSEWGKLCATMYAGLSELQHWAGLLRQSKILIIKSLPTLEAPSLGTGLQDLRDKRPHLFHGAQTNAMVLFMWQDDMIGVVRFIDECLERILYTSDQP